MKDVIVDSIGSFAPHWVYVMCMFSVLPSLSFCKVYAGSALLSEPHICVNCAFTFEVLDHASLWPLHPSPSPLHRFDSLSCYGELADPQIMPLALFWAVKKRKNQLTWFRSRVNGELYFDLVRSVPYSTCLFVQLHMWVFKHSGVWKLLQPRTR